MHPTHRPTTGQQKRVRHYAGKSDSYAMFNLLTGPRLLDRVEALLPDHRERLYPPTVTLSMFLAQALSADGGCQQVVDEGALPVCSRGRVAPKMGARKRFRGPVRCVERSQTAPS